MTALTDRVRTAIEARLQVARAADTYYWINIDIKADNEEIAEAVRRLHDGVAPDVVARSCEADLELLGRFEIALEVLDPKSDGAWWIGLSMANFATRYGGVR